MYSRFYYHFHSSRVTITHEYILRLISVSIGGWGGLTGVSLEWDGMGWGGVWQIARGSRGVVSGAVVCVLFMVLFVATQKPATSRGLEHQELEDSRTLFASASYVCICICICIFHPLSAQCICICVRPITIKSIYLLSFYRKRRPMANNANRKENISSNCQKW